MFNDLGMYAIFGGVLICPVRDVVCCFRENDVFAGRGDAIPGISGNRSRYVTVSHPGKCG